jgi:hypothetical protein
VRITKRVIRTKVEVDGGVCTQNLEYPEITGIGDPAREKALNAELRPEGSPCDAAGSAERDFVVVVNQAGVLSLRLGSFGHSEGAAHPYREPSSLNIVVATGEKLEQADVFRPESEKAIVRLLAPLFDRALGALPKAEAEHVRSLIEGSIGPDFVLEKRGIRFHASLPHAFQGLVLDGFFLTYAELAPVLLSTSPAALLWRPRDARP